MPPRTPVIVPNYPLLPAISVPATCREAVTWYSAASC